MNKILDLAKPKVPQLEEKKEKNELLGEINQRKEDAAEFINKLYKTNEAGTINEYVTSIESLDYVKEKIEQFKFELQQKIKEHNEEQFKRKEQQQHLDELQNLLQ